MRLMALLDELVRDKGARKAAADLDVDHRTLAASLESGRLTRRMRVALDRALLAGGGSPAREQQARNDELAERLERVEERVEVVGQDAGQGLAAVQDEVEALRNEQGQALQRVESRLAKVEGGGGDAKEEEGESAGDAWALVQEWRGLKETHPSRGRGLEWLRQQQRLLEMELALLEEHGLTLPPETYPLRGLDRGAQVNWRQKALVDTQRERAKREILLWLRRLLSLGMWRK